MPVLVLYKAKNISQTTASKIVDILALQTKQLLDAAIEVRIVEPISSYNANELHLEMQFRDFGEWSDEKIANYHQTIMDKVEQQLKNSSIKCAFSFYILPSTPPRSMWAQIKL